MAYSQTYGWTLTLIACLSLTGISVQAKDDIALGITPLRNDLGQRSFDAACSSCHYRGEGKLPFGTRGPPAETSPDELAQFILFGKAPEDDEGGMPAFGPYLTDADVARMVVWLRSTSKPDAPWPDVAASVTKMRTLGRREED